jgi:DNA polymerase-3 subunit delta'
MLFADVIGQERVKTHLLTTVKENRISHAQLFLGNEGYGTLPLVLAYAQYIMCLNPTENDACGECSACRKVSKFQHPDLNFVFPVVSRAGAEKPVSDHYIKEWREFLTNQPYGSYNDWLDAMGAENSQGIIRVDESKEIIRKLNLKSYESDYKVMIIWYAEKMNAETANKLLKLLEEPPANTFFFLVAQSSEFLLSTILSRTQLVKVTRITEDELFLGIKKHHSLPDDKARQIARLSEGNYLLAKEYISASVDTKQNFENFTQLMRLSYKGNFIELVKWVDEISKIGREKQKAFLIYSLRMVRENLVLNQQQKELVRMSAEEETFAARFSTFIHPNNTPLLNQELDKAYLHITRNANPKVVFLDVCIKLNRILKMG